MGNTQSSRGSMQASLGTETPARRSGGGGRVARRALLTTAAVGACAAATPFVIAKGAELSETEITALLQREIGSLEGIALGDALRIAELTRQIVQYIVLPLARFMSTISGDALQVMIDGLVKIEAFTHFIHLSINFLSGLISLLTIWQTNVTLLPISLQALTNTDINGAETYLRALRAKVSGGTTTPA